MLPPEHEFMPASSASPDGPLRFGAYEVDPRSGELRKHGIRIKLQDQPCKILLALLEKPGAVVTREELRQRIWGDDTFVDFDHGLSAAVNRLRETLGDSAERPRYVETLARRGYRFVAAVEAPPQPAAPAPVPATSFRKLAWAAAAVVILGAGVLLVWLVRNRETRSPEQRVVPLTSLAGAEMMPAFSPDGRQVAFVWDGEKQDNRDIYIKLVGSATESRLTSDPAEDKLPSWSPDGSMIAFSSDRGEPGIYVVSPLGGPERKIAAIRTLSRPAWLPDSKHLVVSKAYFGREYQPGDGALFLVPVEGGGTPRPLLKPPEQTWFQDPAVASNGALAFAACKNPMAGRYECRLESVSLDRRTSPLRKPRPITQPLEWIDGLSWDARGGELIVGRSSSRGQGSYLWRVSSEGNTEPVRLEVAGSDAFDPSIDHRGKRIAFSRSASQPDIWRWERGRQGAAFLKSSGPDALPQYSSDGRRIALQSQRGAEGSAIWTANSDGTGWIQLTQGLGLRSGTPRWSPGDRWIAFDAWNESRSWDIWKVESSGGPAQRLTQGPGSSFIPSWSRDGKWVYFASDRSGRNEVWRVPSEGGQAQQITRNGGHVAFDSADGKTLFYTKSERGAEGLYSVPIPGGAETRVLDVEVPARGFAVFADGIFHLAPSSAGRPSSADPGTWLVSYLRVYPQNWGRSEIRFHEFSSGRSRVLGEVEGPLALGFAVSPDRQTVLYARFNAEADLFMIEGFR